MLYLISSDHDCHSFALLVLLCFMLSHCILVCAIKIDVLPLRCYPQHVFESGTIAACVGNDDTD